MTASDRAVRSASPECVRKLALGEVSLDDDYGKARDAESRDMAKVLASSMTWYVEFLHVDGRFIALFQTLPGYATR
jgi:hypothetical protein